MTQVYASASRAATAEKDARVQIPPVVGLDAAFVPEPIRDRILACQTEDDWDDEGATGITLQACTSAVEFLETLLKQDTALPMPQISPTVHGSIGLYWRKGDTHLIVRPTPDLNTAFYQQEEAGSDSLWGEETKKRAVNRVLALLESGLPVYSDRKGEGCKCPLPILRRPIPATPAVYPHKI